MASPLPTTKQSVDLAATGSVAGSRIRRDPPGKVQEIRIPDPEERDTRMVVLGIVLFALAIFAIVIGLSSYGGWTPQDVTVRI